MLAGKQEGGLRVAFQWRRRFGTGDQTALAREFGTLEP